MSLTRSRPTGAPPTAASPVTPVTPASLGRRAGRDAVVRIAAGASLWLSLLLVTYWWEADGGVRDLGGWASGLTSVGRESGLVASVLLLVQVLMMARVPVLETAFGQDRLARMHRWIGFGSFNLMVLHVVTITWGYAGGGIPATPRMLWDLTVDYPGMLIADAGTLCLVMVVVTSIRAARRRLRYESWHLMHLYAYLGVGLALPHQLWTGQQFLGSTAKTVFWWTAWALTALAVLVWRVGVPSYRTLRHHLVVSAVVPESDRVVSVHLTGRHLDRLKVEAGQFLTWRFLTGSGWSRAHPYSLSAAPDGRSLRITVQAVGDGSAAASGLKPGTRVLVEGPYGRLTARARTRRRVAFIGAGVGITPLRALAEALDYAPGEAVLLQRHSAAPLFSAELDGLFGTRGLQWLNLPGGRRSDTSWLGTGIGTLSDVDALRYWMPDVAERDVYVCGPETWTDLVHSSLLAAGVPPDRVHLEKFAW